MLDTPSRERCSWAEVDPLILWEMLMLDEDADGLGGRTRYRWTVRDPATFRYARLAG